MMPFAFDRSPFSCPRCHDPLTMQLGQNADTGNLEQHHFCGCGYVHVDNWQAPARNRMTYEQILERRLAHVDREVA